MSQALKSCSLHLTVLWGRVATVTWTLQEVRKSPSARVLCPLTQQNKKAETDAQMWGVAVPRKWWGCRDGSGDRPVQVWASDSIAMTHIQKKLAIVSHICNPNTGQAETGSSPGLTDQPACSRSSRPMRDPISKYKVSKWRLSFGLHTQARTHMFILVCMQVHTQASMYTQAYIHIHKHLHTHEHTKEEKGISDQEDWNYLINYTMKIQWAMYKISLNTNIT